MPSPSPDLTPQISLHSAKKKARVSKCQISARRWQLARLSHPFQKRAQINGVRVVWECAHALHCCECRVDEFWNNFGDAPQDGMWLLVA